VKENGELLQFTDELFLAVLTAACLGYGCRLFPANSRKTLLA
jgi:hypothetical protein